MADDTSPSSLRLPASTIPFTTDLSAVERDLDALKERIELEFPAAFERAVAGMAAQLDTLKDRLSELSRPLTESLDAASQKADTIASAADQGRGRIGAAGLEGREEISIQEVIQRFGTFQERNSVEDLLGPNQLIAEALRENTDLLREIRDLLAQREDGA